MHKGDTQITYGAVNLPSYHHVLAAHGSSKMARFPATSVYPPGSRYAHHLHLACLKHFNRVSKEIRQRFKIKIRTELHSETVLFFYSNDY